MSFFFPLELASHLILDPGMLERLTWADVKVSPDGVVHVSPHKVSSSVVVYPKDWDTETQQI